MRRVSLAAGLCLLAAACSGGGTIGSGPASFDAMSAVEHLACAVDISAYTWQLAGGKVPEDRDLAGKAAVALGWHHNAYAIPQGAGDQGDLINRKREDLMAGDKPEAIAQRAAACIASAMAKQAAG